MTRPRQSFLLFILIGLCTLSAPRTGATQPRDAWAELWSEPSLVAADQAWLDRDPRRVREVVTGAGLDAMPPAVRGRLLFFDALAAERLGHPAEGATSLARAIVDLDGAREASLADHARYHRARMLLDTGEAGAREALALLRRVEPQASVLGAEHPLLLARALVGSGRLDDALEHLARVEPQRGERLYAQRDELLYLRGLARWRSGKRREARADFTTLAMDFPTSPRAVSVLPLVDLDLAPAQRLELAQAFLDARHYDATTSVLETVADATASALGDEARYKLGYVHYRLRRIDRDVGIRYLEAVAAGKGPRADDAMVLLARAWMRREEYDKALDVWRRFRLRFPDHKDADEALYYHGWLPMDREQWDEAIPAFERYIEAWPKGDRIENVRWYLGWSHFRAGRPREAVKAWRELLRHSTNWLETSRALYWLVQALGKVGASREAQPLAERLAREFPHTYYGQLLAIRSGRPTDLDLPATAPEPLDPADAWASLDGAASVRARVRLVRDLIHLDLLEEANAHVNARLRKDVRDALARRRGAQVAEDLVLFLMEEVGDVAGVYRENAGRGAATFKLDVDADNVGTWRRVYPRPYRRVVEHEARRRGISPLFVWSIMQKESGYDPSALSYADAMGLMQIIPKTGRRIAAELGESYREGMLFDPHTNIAYAVWYLDQLLRKFGGQYALAAAAYNGGPTAVVRWIEQNGRGEQPLPFDAWIEEIAYDQARGYARKVLTILGRYIMVYPSRAESADALRDGLYPPNLQVVDTWLDNIDF